MTNATLKTDLKIDNLVVFFLKVGSKKCRGAPQCTLHIVAQVVSQCRGGLLKYRGAKCSLHIVDSSLAQFILQGGLTMRGWSPKVSRCTLHIQRWSHNAEVVSFCQVLRAVRGGLHKRGGGEEQKSWKRNPSIQHH